MRLTVPAGVSVTLAQPTYRRAYPHYDQNPSLQWRVFWWYDKGMIDKNHPRHKNAAMLQPHLTRDMQVKREQQAQAKQKKVTPKRPKKD